MLFFLPEAVVVFEQLNFSLTEGVREIRKNCFGSCMKFGRDPSLSMFVAVNSVLI